MTENEERFEELKDAVCRLVCIAEDAICREGFEELDNAGAEIIGCLEEIQQYRAIGTIEEFKALKEKSEPMKLAKEKGFCIGKDKDGGEIYENKECCPSCGLYGMESLLRYDWDGCYCPKCGQKLDWN